MARGRKEQWLGLIVVALGFIPLALMARWGYINLTNEPLHPDAAGVPSAVAFTPSPEWTTAVEASRSIVRAQIVEQNLPALSVAVGKGGAVVWAESFGWADLEQRVPAAPEMRFRLGTASEALTSAGAALLVERGVLDLEDEIQRHVPAFPRKEWPITLRHLMGHLSGLVTDSGDEGPLLGTHCQRPGDALPTFSQAPLLFEPGTDFRDSSYGWILVSAAIEAAAGESFPSFMQQQVFEPLGMKDTEVDSLEPMRNRATPYFPRFGADPGYGLHLTRELDYSCYAGASVFLSTPSDMVRFAMAIHDGKLLQPSTVAVLQTSQRTSSGRETGYGLGWDLETTELAGRSTARVGHDGEVLGGTVASFMTFPEHGVTVSVFSNISYADTALVATKIAEVFAGVRTDGVR